MSSTSLKKGISVLLAGTIAMTCMMGAMAAIGPISGSENIPYNVLQEQFRDTLQIGGVGAVVRPGGSGSCGTNATYIVDEDGTLTISGTGDIRSDAFAGSISITQVVIEEGITSIGSMAFSDCSYLESVTLPQSLESIGDRAFNNCTKLNTINLPEGMSSIGAQVFMNCRSLTQITIPDSITEIKDQTFQGCNSLTEINGGEGLTKVAFGAFYCDKTVQTTLNTSNEVLQNYNWSANNRELGGTSSEDNESCGENATWTLDESGTLTISGTGAINDEAFKNNTKIKKVIIEEGITSIGGYAFYRCENLTSVTLPQSLTDIGDQAFQYCYYLKVINGGEGITNIGSQAFYCPYSTKITLNSSNESLKNYNWANDNRVIPAQLGSSGTFGQQSSQADFYYTLDMDGTLTITILEEHKNTEIVDYAELFKGNPNIKKVIIGEGIEILGQNLFEGCQNLESIELADSVWKIYYHALYGCNKLTYIDVGTVDRSRTLSYEQFTATGSYNSNNLLVTTINSDAPESFFTDFDWAQFNRTLVREGSDDQDDGQDDTLTPVGENWDYNGEQGSFGTDKVQNPSVEDDINSLTDPDATVEGLDEKQGLESEYETADASSEETLVAVTKASDFIVAVPKVLIMDGNGEQSTAEYKISVFGHVDPAKRVTVTPEASFEMVNQGKADVVYTAQVSQPETGINGIDILEDPSDEGTQYLTGTITANLKRAGSYKGTMNFTIDYVDYVE